MSYIYIPIYAFNGDELRDPFVSSLTLLAPFSIFYSIKGKKKMYIDANVMVKAL